MFHRPAKILALCSMLCLLASCATFSDEDEKAAQLHLQLGVSQLNQGNFPQALKELLIAEKMDSKNPQIQNSLGLAYYVRQRYDLAEKHVLKAVTLKNDFTDARNNLANIYLEQGKYDLALEESNKVVADLTYIYPEKGQINLGLIYFKKGQFALAKTKFQKAMDLQKDNCLASSYYGRTLYELKDLKKASEALDQAVGFCQRSQFDEPHYYSALTYYQMGRVEKAEVRLEELIKLYPRGKYVDKAKDMLETIKK